MSQDYNEIKFSMEKMKTTEIYLKQRLDDLNKVTIKGQYNPSKVTSKYLLRFNKKLDQIYVDNNELKFSMEKMKTTEIYLKQRLDKLNKITVKGQYNPSKVTSKYLMQFSKKIDQINVENNEIKFSMEKLKTTEIYLKQRLDQLNKITVKGQYNPSKVTSKYLL